MISKKLCLKQYTDNIIPGYIQEDIYSDNCITKYLKVLKDFHLSLGGLIEVVQYIQKLCNKNE